MTEPTPKKPRRRARKADGTYRGNDPTTATNEAWEPVEIEESLPKTKDYTVTQKVSGPSTADAGKYNKRGGVRPSFGSVTSTTY